jgi:hypothetical protein
MKVAIDLSLFDSNNIWDAQVINLLMKDNRGRGSSIN